jgi:hypothetical protein
MEVTGFHADHRRRRGDGRIGDGRSKDRHVGKRSGGGVAPLPASRRNKEQNSHYQRVSFASDTAVCVACGADNCNVPPPDPMIEHCACSLERQ